MIINHEKSLPVYEPLFMAKLFDEILKTFQVPKVCLRRYNNNKLWRQRL